jgi:hypothetical protein
MSKTGVKPELALERAQHEVAEAKKRFANTKGALQYRLKPSTLASNAWDGVREKSSVAADGAVGAARGHPGAIGGAVAAITLFLAREQIWRTLSGMFGRDRAEEDKNIVHADLESADGNYDLTAPTVERSKTEGVIA